MGFAYYSTETKTDQPWPLIIRAVWLALVHPALDMYDIPSTWLRCQDSSVCRRLYDNINWENVSALYQSIHAPKPLIFAAVKKEQMTTTNKDADFERKLRTLPLVS